MTEKVQQSTFLLLQRQDLSPELQVVAGEIDERRGFKPGMRDVNVTFWLLPASNDEFVMLTRSMPDILIQLAFQADVLTEHVSDSRTITSVALSHSPGTELAQLMKFHHGTMTPEEGIIALKYRDLWLWIDDRDLRSKRIFLFVMILFSPKETGRQSLPLATIPAG